MPRIPRSLLRRAHQIDQLLPLLLRTCRDLRSARNELRWLQEHAVAVTSNDSNSNSLNTPWRPVLYKLCVERARGKPLQYILGNQPFGDLEILCRKGVLIPRPETEAYTTHIANQILERYKLKPPNDQSIFRVLDLCTGTGCISLLLHALLAKYIPKTEILGIDISPKAIALANQNLHHNIALGHLPQSAKKHVQFLQADVFLQNSFEKHQWDMVISNPPYISPQGFNKDTSRSVRNYEPRIALVPLCGSTFRRDWNAPEIDSSIGDAFYPKLLDVAEKSNACLLLLEVADLEQARRVVAQAVKRCCWNKFEIWRDWPDERIISKALVHGDIVDIVGKGNGRSVLISKI